MKSVAMRKVDSTEGHARTPQPTSTSTPASAEKPRLHPERPIDQKALKEFRAQEAKFYPIGTNNKRHMQAVLTKPGTTPDIRLEAIMQGIEGLMAYMLAFHYRDKVDESSHRPLTPASWEQFFPIWNFVYGHTRAFPELAALLDQLGAVSREQLVRIYLQDESRNWDRLTTGLKMRDQAWQSVKKSESHLRNGKLGVKEGLGAVSEVAEAVGFGVSVLRGYAAERGMEWKGDESLPGTSSAANNANA